MSSTDACECKECVNLHSTARTENPRDEDEVWKVLGARLFTDFFEPTFLSSYKNEGYLTISHVHNLFFYKQANDVWKHT